MICCKAYGADCRQGRDCPERAPTPMSAPASAVVATAKPPQRKYSCAELGVCQCKAPGRCECDVDPEDPDSVCFWGGVASRIFVAFLVVLSICVVSGLIGYLSGFAVGSLEV